MSSSFDTRYLVDPQQMQQLVEHYKGGLTENAQLNRAALLAAQKHALLESNLPPAIKTARVKPIGRELSKITKRVRLGGAPPAAAAPLEDEEDLVTGPLDTMLKSLLKQRPKAPGRSSTTPAPTGTPRRPRPVPAPRRVRPLVEELPFAETPGTSPWLSATERAEQLIQASKRRTRQVQQKRKRRSEAARLKPLPGWEDFTEGVRLRRPLHGQDY